MMIRPEDLPPRREDEGLVITRTYKIADLKEGPGKVVSRCQ